MAHVNIIYRTMDIEYQIINKVKEVIMEAIFAVINTTWAVVKIRPAQVVFIRTLLEHYYEDRFRIHVFICSSDIWLSYIHSRLFTTSRVYLEPNDNQFQVDLLAQLVEHCTGIAEVMGSNPVQAWIFFRSYFHYCSTSVHYRVDRFHIHVFNRSSDIWLSYIHSRLKWNKLAFLRKKVTC